MAQGGQALARAEARGSEPALLLFAQAGHRHRRGRAVRRPDGQQPAHRRVPPAQQSGAVDRAEPRVHRRHGHADRPCGAGGVLAEPRHQRAGGQPAAPATQVGAGRAQCAVRRRSAGHCLDAGPQLPPRLRLRGAQLRDRQGARAARRGELRGAGALRHRPHRPGPAGRDGGAEHARHRARRTQPVRHRLLRAGPVARAADGAACLRSPHRLLPERAQRFQRRPRALAAPALRQPLASGEEGPGGGAVRAGQAHHLLAGPQHPGQVPRRHQRRHPGVEQGLRAHRFP
ncbi:hypothetical protein X551_04588 [Methylibium sp. T29]|nr:hypothetical protein X551_04588 [Methylibium sp. T29]